MNISSKTKAEFLHILRRQGSDSVYRKSIGRAFIRLKDVERPDIELLDLSDGFLKLYRRSGTAHYFDLSKILRRAAHTVYRQLLRMNKIEINNRFLNVVEVKAE